MKMTSGSWRSTTRIADEKALGVESDLALFDGSQVVAVQVLDRVFDRHDVAGPDVIDVIDHRCKGRRLARARRARDEHETALLFCQPPNDIR